MAKYRVLFVDDESRILTALQRMLRPLRDTWEMSFSSSGADALELLDRSAFDVIVTDMRMPGMDGAELLHRVRELHPHVVRIILSGYADEAATLRAVPVAHQYLTKPCEAETLKLVIARCCELHGVAHDQRLRSAVGSIDVLPACPKVYSSIEKALQDPEFEVSRIAKLVARDPSVSAQILKLVNSSFFGLAQDVTTVDGAVNYLGAKTIRSVVLSIELFRDFDACRIPGFSLDRLQQQSLLMAALARSAVRDTPQADSAFLAGMLHDVGSLVLALRMPDDFSACLAEMQSTNEPRHVVEQRRLGFTHADIGAYLLGMWHFPNAIVEAVAHQHRPNDDPNPTLDVLGALRLAAAVVDYLQGGVDESGKDDLRLRVADAVRERVIGEGQRLLTQQNA